jgi:GPH family glycoside/pentoside/hexuronide:cation symporter
MMADVVESSELRTGRRSEGLFFSASAFVAKVVSGVGIFISSAILALSFYRITKADHDAAVSELAART